MASETSVDSMVPPSASATQEENVVDQTSIGPPCEPSYETDSMNMIPLAESTNQEDETKIPLIASTDDISNENSYNLMVNYVPKSIDSSTFRQMFEAHGAVIDSKLVLDQQTKEHIGYGFVTYSKLLEAKKAIQELNGFAIGGKWLKVAFSNKTLNGTKRANLYVSGIPVSFSEDDIVKLFQDFEVFSVKILFDAAGKSRRVCFVMLPNEDEAERAIATLHDYTIPDTSDVITVKRAVEQQQRGRRDSFPSRFGPGPMMNSYNNSFYPQMPQTYNGMSPAYPSRSPIASSSYGPTRSARLSTPRPNPISSDRRPAEHPDDPYKPGENPAFSGYCLFMYNMPRELDEAGIRELYQPFANLTDIKIMRDSAQLNQSKGFGFVNVATLHEAKAAIAALNGHSINQRILKVAFKKPRNAPDGAGTGPFATTGSINTPPASASMYPPRVQGMGAMYPSSYGYVPTMSHAYQQQPPPQAQQPYLHQTRGQQPMSSQPPYQYGYATTNATPAQQQNATAYHTVQSNHAVSTPATTTPASVSNPAAATAPASTSVVDALGAIYTSKLRAYEQSKASGSDSATLYASAMEAYKVYQAAFCAQQNIHS